MHDTYKHLVPLCIDKLKGRNCKMHIPAKVGPVPGPILDVKAAADVQGKMLLLFGIHTAAFLKPFSVEQRPSSTGSRRVPCYSPGSLSYVSSFPSGKRL